MAAVTAQSGNYSGRESVLGPWGLFSNRVALNFRAVSFDCCRFVFAEELG